MRKRKDEDDEKQGEELHSVEKTQGQREGEAGRMLIKAEKTHHDVLFSSELGVETLLFC